MPPMRSVSAIKPVKTERTHEENQERAYIAASRRSDRSLEARVESARRASEIHKRRTGRSLRVTEQDVVNEEMYEEEDDDLPLQYRRLTAHLNSGDPHFNRRLAAYLTNHVAMRTALDQAISSSYAQQYPNGQQWQGQPFNPMQSQQPWMMNQQGSQASHFPSPMMMPPQMMHRSPASFGQSPYPASLGPGFQPDQQSAHQDHQAQQASEGQRRQSAPAQADTHTLQSSQRTSSSTSLHSAGSNAVSPQQKSASVPLSIDNAQSHSPLSRMNMAPFSTALPPETQMFFNSGFDNHCFMPNNMLGGEKPQQPFYSYNPNGFNKARNVHPSYDGMNQTLAPGALNSASDAYGWPTPPSATTDEAQTPFTPAFNYGFDAPYDINHGSQKPMFSMQEVTSPGDTEWTTFLDTNAWAETSS